MKFKIALAILLVVFLVAFACTSKKPSQFDEVTLFKGKVTVKLTGQPVENALVYLTWEKKQECTCVLNQIQCAPERDSLFYFQPANQNGEYLLEVRWKELGFLFPKPKDPQNPGCQMQFLIEAWAQNVGYDSTLFTLSAEDRTAAQVHDLELEF